MAQKNQFVLGKEILVVPVRLSHQIVCFHAKVRISLIVLRSKVKLGEGVRLTIFSKTGGGVMLTIFGAHHYGKVSGNAIVLTVTRVLEYFFVCTEQSLFHLQKEHERVKLGKPLSLKLD